MKEIKSEPGMHVSEAAKRMVEAVKTDGDVFLTFNDICLAANQFSTVESICADFDRLCQIRRAEYEASAEGKAAKARQNKEQKDLQAKADELMEQLPHLDFTNVGNLLHWLCAIEPSRDRIGVMVDFDKIQRIFKKHGYEQNACCGDEFDENDRETYARWIIGQGIQTISPPLIRSFTETWRQKFHKH